MAAFPASLVRRAGEGAVTLILHLLFLVMIGSATLQVATRYLFGGAFGWTEEVTRLALILYTFFGAAAAMASGRHFRFGDLVDGLPPRLRALVDGVAAALIVVPVAMVTWLAVGSGLSTTERATSVALSYTSLYFMIALGLALTLIFFLVTDQRFRRPLAVAVAIAAGLTLAGLFLYVPPPDVSDALQSTVLVGSLCLFLAMGVPVGFALLAASMFAFWLDPYSPFEVVPKRMLGGVDSFLLIAMPFFLMAGEIMNRSGLTGHIVGIARAVVGHFRGGLAHVNIAANFLMGGLSGSSSADCAAMGKLLIPEMTKQGYRVPFSAATTASASILANLVPPSINLLIYSSLASASVGALFLAGIVPAVILMLAMMLVVYFTARTQGLPVEHDSFRGARFAQSLRIGVWALGFPAIIIFGIRGGVFTATEAAAVAVLYATFISIVVYRNFPWRELGHISRTVAEDSAVILFILAASTPFAWMLTVQQVPQAVAASLAPIAGNWVLLMLLINALLLVVGLVLEPAPAMVILVPILLPVLQQAHIDLVYFGVVMVANLFIGALTPPIGNLAFIAAMAAGVQPSAVFRALVPFIFTLIAALMLITFVPAATLFLSWVFR